MRAHIAVFLGAVALFAFPAAACGQDAEAEVEAVVNALFDAMRAGDATAAAALFHPEARLQSIGEQNGQPSLRGDEVAGFIEAIGAPHAEVWDERIWDLQILVDGGLATAWMRYAFYLGDTFSHCGVNAFQLFRDTEGWKILQITDTRRRDDCREPV